MIFLHELQDKSHLKGFHLSSNNVYIDEETNTAQINMGDTYFSFQQTNERIKFLEPQYIAPELLEKKPADEDIQAGHMWSFSVILWEIEHRAIPFYGLSAMEIGLKVAYEGLRLETESDNYVCKLIKICMNDEANKRPVFSKVAPLLTKVVIFDGVAHISSSFLQLIGAAKFRIF